MNTIKIAIAIMFAMLFALPAKAQTADIRHQITNDLREILIDVFAMHDGIKCNHSEGISKIGIHSFKIFITSSRLILGESNLSSMIRPSILSSISSTDKVLAGALIRFAKSFKKRTSDWVGASMRTASIRIK